MCPPPPQKKNFVKGNESFRLLWTKQSLFTTNVMQSDVRRERTANAQTKVWLCSSLSFISESKKHSQLGLQATYVDSESEAPIMQNV